MNRLSVVSLALLVAVATIGCALPAQADKAAPSISSVSPSSVVASAQGFTLNVFGSNFTGNCVVLWNGSPRPTVTISGNQLQAFISSADIAAAGTAQVAVVNPQPSPQQSNSVPLTIQSPPSLQITTNSLPTAVVQLPYSAAVANSGGVAPYTWKVASGQLPPGLALDATSGAISGVPGQSGKYSFIAQVSDSSPAPQTASQSLAVSVTAPSPLLISTTSLPNGTAQVPYSSTLMATGGTTPYSWSVVSGAFPPGLALSASSGAVTGTPSTSGQYSFTVQVTDSAASPQTTIQAFTVSIAATILQLSVSPTSLSFGNVSVGSSSTQTALLTNTGNSSVSISQINVSGAGFGTSGLTPPVILAAGQSTAFSVVFAPTSSGSVTGSVTVLSNATNSPTTIALSGSGVAATLQLTASPTSLSFGNVTVGSSSTQTALLTNTGNSSVSISQINVSGAGFSTSGLTPPVTLAAGQSATLTVVFAPTSSGSVTGSVSVVSNASNSPTIALSGSGVQPISHSVTLSWSPSTSVVIGYNVYRGTQPGGPYTKLTSSPVPTSTYTDSTVQAAQTYFYVVTAVDSTNVESVFSNQVSATIPNP